MGRKDARQRRWLGYLAVMLSLLLAQPLLLVRLPGATGSAEAAAVEPTPTVKADYGGVAEGFALHLGGSPGAIRVARGRAEVSGLREPYAGAVAQPVLVRSSQGEQAPIEAKAAGQGSEVKAGQAGAAGPFSWEGLYAEARSTVKTFPAAAARTSAGALDVAAGTVRASTLETASSVTVRNYRGFQSDVETSIASLSLAGGTLVISGLRTRLRAWAEGHPQQAGAEAEVGPVHVRTPAGSLTIQPGQEVTIPGIASVSLSLPVIEVQEDGTRARVRGSVLSIRLLPGGGILGGLTGGLLGNVPLGAPLTGGGKQPVGLLNTGTGLPQVGGLVNGLLGGATGGLGQGALGGLMDAVTGPLDVITGAVTGLLDGITGTVSGLLPGGTVAQEEGALVIEIGTGEAIAWVPAGGVCFTDCFALSKLPTSDTVEPGGIIEYRIAVGNDTPGTVLHQVTLRDPLPRHTSFEGWSSSVPATVYYDANTRTVTWHLGTLAPGQSRLITLYLRVDTTAPLGSDVINRVSVEAANGARAEAVAPPVRIGAKEHQAYIKGFPDLSFRGTRPVTRAQMAAIAARLVDLRSRATGSLPYRDVPRDHWAYKYILAVYNAGIMGGYGDGTFRPDAPILRAEMAKVLVLMHRIKPMFNETGGTRPTFSDVRPGDWYFPYVETAVRFGFFAGDGSGRFFPDAPTQRYHAVKMINTAMGRGPLVDGNEPVRQHFWDVPRSSPWFGWVEEATAPHIGVRPTAGAAERVIRYTGRREDVW